MFIKKINLESDIIQIQKDVDIILTKTSWEPYNQIGFNHRINSVNKWFDCVGNIEKRYPNEKINLAEFCVWNDEVPFYITQQINLLKEKEKFNLGRVRIMRLLPKNGLTIHHDIEKRYHFVIKTNPSALIGQKFNIFKEDSDIITNSITYHLPADGHWYEIDTTQTHYVYNGGLTDRIHLVVCKLN